MVVPDPTDVGVKLYVRGNPVAQPRAKAVNRGNRAGIYTPTTADGWKTLVSLAIRDLPRREGGSMLWLRFVFQRPASHYGAKGLRASAPELHEKRPDADNLAKSTMDSMVDAGFLADDKHVVGLFTTKEWGTEAGCHITIRKAKKGGL